LFCRNLSNVIEKMTDGAAQVYGIKCGKRKRERIELCAGDFSGVVK
jgi:hypothetical protein